MFRLHLVRWAVLSVLVASLGVSAEANSELFKGFDLSDIVNHEPTRLPEALPLLGLLKENRGDFWGNLVGLPHELLNTELYDSPVLNGDRKVFRMMSTLRDSNNRILFRKFEVDTDLASENVLEIRFVEEIPLSNTRFSIEVGLIPRKLILKDETHGLTKIYPIGVGAFDTVTAKGQTRLVTPLMSGASVERRYVIPKRRSPSYYKGKPFIRVTNSRGSPTPIGFHIEVNDKFIRGFDSHGCVRLREKDLMELFYIVYTGPLEAVPVSMAFKVSHQTEHPVPLHERYYQRVKNFGSRDNPKSRRGSDGLVILEKVSGPAPVHLLTGTGLILP